MQAAAFSQSSSPPGLFPCPLRAATPPPRFPGQRFSGSHHMRFQFDMGLDPWSLRIFSCCVCAELGSGIALISAPARAPYNITRNERPAPLDVCGFPDCEFQAARIRACESSCLAVHTLSRGVVPQQQSHLELSCVMVECRIRKGYKVKPSILPRTTD